MPRAVLWDMDGTLVDTEPYWMAAETELVNAYGGSWTTDQAMRLVGLGLEDSAAILQRAGVDRAISEIVEHLTDSVCAQLSSKGVPWRPGARELLEDLRATEVQSALVTMSLRRMADTVVERIGFDAFDVVVTGDEVLRPKPFPEPYLQAARMLGVDITDTVVLEDSPNGLRAGLASGAVTIGVPHMVPLAGLGADELWTTLAGRGVDDLAAALRAQRRAAAQGSTR